MKFRLLHQRHAWEDLRWHGAVAILAAIVIVSFVALATLCLSDRRVDEARFTHQAVASAADRARAILEHQQRDLDQLTLVAAAGNDAATQQFLDQLPSLEPGVRGVAVTDSTGTVQFRSPDQAGKNDLDEPALAALAADAAREAVAHPDAAILVTQTLRDRETVLVGLARPWLQGDGSLGGVALVAIDPTAVGGLDLVRGDGSPLFSDGKPGVQQVALGTFPLMLRVPPSATGPRVMHGAWPLITLAAFGVAGLAGLLTVLIGRLSAAERQVALQTIVTRDLREKLAAASATADRTDELSRAKSQFFAQVTHELRTPLNAILGFSEAIRQEMFGPVANPRYLEYSGLIHDAGAHLLSLINDLLDNARIEAGKMEIAPIRVSASALARSALDLVELLAEGRDITMTIAGLATCPDLNVDPRAMKQVLVNLLSNAIKYTPPGGQIDVRFLEGDDGAAAIEIADTGIGMSAEDMRLAFEPFGRAGAIEARHQQGSGLGLSLARALVRLHGGDLTLSSRLGLGTTATVILPPEAAFSANATRAATPAKAA
jgi:signal transduction histidine kinase